MKFKVVTTTRLGASSAAKIPCVELWVDGIRFVHDCDSMNEAFKVALAASRWLEVVAGKKLESE